MHVKILAIVGLGHTSNASSLRETEIGWCVGQLTSLIPRTQTNAQPETILTFFLLFFLLIERELFFLVCICSPLGFPENA